MILPVRARFSTDGELFEKSEVKGIFVAALLTCQSYVVLGCWAKDYIEPASSCFPPKFLSGVEQLHQARNREHVVLYLFSDMFSGASCVELHVEKQIDVSFLSTWYF